MCFIKTVGMEIEYNNEEHPNFTSWDNPLLNKDYSEENEIIWERQTKVLNINSCLSFFCELTEKFFSDFELKEGKYDTYAESNHLHINYIKHIDNNNINMFLCLIPFFSRNNRFFRDAVETEDMATIYWLGSHEDICSDSKSYWITYNTYWKTLEFRLNENHFPWFIYIMQYLCNIIKTKGYMYKKLFDLLYKWEGDWINVVGLYHHFKSIYPLLIKKSIPFITNKKDKIFYKKLYREFLNQDCLTNKDIFNIYKNIKEDM